MRVNLIKQCHKDNKDLYGTNRVLRKHNFKHVTETEYRYIGRHLIDELREEMKQSKTYKLITAIANRVYK